MTGCLSVVVLLLLLQLQVLKGSWCVCWDMVVFCSLDPWTEFQSRASCVYRCCCLGAAIAIEQLVPRA